MVLVLFIGRDHATTASFEVALAPYEASAKQVVINAVQNRPDVTLTLSLAEHLELSGYPGQRIIQWNTSLVEGKNLLSLPLRLLGNEESHFTVQMSHRMSEQMLRVDVIPKTPQQPSIRT